MLPIIHVLEPIILFHLSLRSGSLLSLLLLFPFGFLCLQRSNFIRRNFVILILSRYVWCKSDVID